MQISVSVRHGELSPATQEQIREKVGKLLRFWDRLTSIQVTVNLEHRDDADVEVRVTAEHSDDFVASERSSNLIGGLDKVLHRLEQQIRKQKEKKIGNHRGAAAKHRELPEA